MRYLFIFFFIAGPLFVSANPVSLPMADITITTKPVIDKAIPVPDHSLAFILTLTPREITKLTGRKLTLKEKIALKILQFKIRREAKPVKNPGNTHSKKGQTSMILGIIGLAVLIVPLLGIASVPLAILAIIFGSQARKENKNDSQAKTGIILGIITLGIIVLALILIVAILASIGWY